MELYENCPKERSCYWRSIPERISKTVERFFYRLGVRIAENPLRWMLGCFIIILICISGLYWFRQEKNPTKLWIPPDSEFVQDTEWLLSHYEEAVRNEIFILTGDNVLDKQTLIKLNEITKRLISIQTSKGNLSWPDVCVKVPVISDYVQRSKRQSFLEDNFFNDDFSSKINQSSFEPAIHIDAELYCRVLETLPMACVMFNILDIWNFDSETIERDSTEEIIAKVNTVKISNTLGHTMNFSELLGGVTLDDRGRIVAATAVKTILMVHVNFLNVDMDKNGNIAGTADWALYYLVSKKYSRVDDEELKKIRIYLTDSDIENLCNKRITVDGRLFCHATEDVLEWESAFLESAKKLSNELQNEKNHNVSLALYYLSDRSFGDISQSSIFQDMDKLAAGIILMFLYVLLILSNYNWVELKFCLTSTGLLCVGGAFILAVAICSLIGIPYGPIHTSLPFLLLGLGIDDIFIFNASWKQIHTYESNLKKPLTKRIGLTLGHAGSAITITSFTDVIAFIIGSSTILPSLQSFCIYAAVGVFVTFLLQITFFVGCFTLDVRRIEEKRNGILPCIVHENFMPKLLEPSSEFSWKLIDILYSRVILTKLGKVVVILITIAAMSVGVMGSLQLQQWFDLMWLLPKESYLSQYLDIKNQKFPSEGYEAFVLMGEDIDYASEFPKIISLTERLKNASYVQNIESWPIDFAKFVSIYYDTDLKTTIVSENDFHHYLSKFLVSRVGGKYQRNFLFNETFICGKKAPRITIATIDIKFTQLTKPQKWIEAMEDSKSIAKEAQVHGYVTVWSKFFGSWTTDKLIGQEVLRNLILALICVMGTTAILIAEIQTCCWILLCVLLTLLNVCGFMYFWGLTIDLVSCIGLELAVGLSVDYAAHVAHAFLNIESREGDKNARTTRVLTAVRHIGAAVVYGAGSTLLAISIMAFSKSYVFLAFFRIFFLVILFGLWHGLILLPVVLSTIGPQSLHVIQRPQPLSEKVNDDED